MIDKIVNTRSSRYWLIFHVLLGLVLPFANSIFVLILLLFIANSLKLVSRGSALKKKLNLVYVISYLASWSLMARMTNMHQFRFPWEFGKYVVFFGALYGIIALQTRKGLVGFLMFFLLVPSMFISSIGDIVWHDIVFNLLGPISIAFVVVAFKDVKVSKEEFQKVLRLMLYPSVTVLAYVFIKTPDLASLEFELGANFATTGGYGSNQVSTALGLGMMLSFFFWVNKWELTGNRNLDLGLTGIFAFQGFLSFSRGGMVGGFLGILVFVFVISASSRIKKRKFNLPSVGKFAALSLIFLIVTFQIADAITGGLLSLRYQGETNHTLEGKSEVSLNSLTTGRFDIFTEDIDIWMNHLVMGTGAGVSRLLRSGNMVSHVELSRLLAEHGLLGLTYVLVLMMLGLKMYKTNTNAKYQGILLALFLVACYTTFHAATRTYVSPLLIGVALLGVQGLKENDTKLY